MKDIHDLPSGIYRLFDPNEDHVVDEDNLELLCKNLKEALRSRLGKQSDGSDRPIRFSALGKPDRQVWYEAHPDGSKEELRPQTYIKFMYGAILEELVLFLAREAGHVVTDCQTRVEIDGVQGSLDAVISGTVVDVKSASSYGFKKFEDNRVTEDDPFGYVEQLSGYADVLTPGEGAAWVAIDKVAGDICVSDLKPHVIAAHKPQPRIEHLKKVISSDDIPDRCYEDKPDGKSGNRMLGTGCSYCGWRNRCWPGLRSFIYSSGPRYLTHVARVPDVLEIKT